MRIWPRSLLGQTLLAAALALVLAQAISAVLLYRGSEQRREAAMVNAAAFQFVGASNPRGRASPPERFDRQRAATQQGGRFPRRLRYQLQDENPVLPVESRETRIEASLRVTLEAQGIAVEDLTASIRPISQDPAIARMAARFPRMHSRILADERDILVAGLRREGAAKWEVARVPVRERERRLMGAILLQTVLLTIVLLVLLYLILRRITRPLALLRKRTERFANTGTPDVPLAPSGPEDVGKLIAAHNAMEARIGAMLDEKDVMLGAIGHDLKTPLAALRVRIESVTDAVQRARMAGTIEEVTRTLDEILELARVGRSETAPEHAELSALAASVVEEFEDMGQPVELVPGPRISRPVEITWIKRGLRNLVTNAVRYGGEARVSVQREGGGVVFRVDDDGPGIPENRIAAMIEPFSRGEASRNRATGGAGLGLALARAVAERHGGTLVLANREDGGLRAEIRLPGT